VCVGVGVSVGVHTCKQYVVRQGSC